MSTIPFVLECGVATMKKLDIECASTKDLCCLCETQNRFYTATCYPYSSASHFSTYIFNSLLENGKFNKKIL